MRAVRGREPTCELVAPPEAWPLPLTPFPCANPAMSSLDELSRCAPMLARSRE